MATFSKRSYKKTDKEKVKPKVGYKRKTREEKDDEPDGREERRPSHNKGGYRKQSGKGDDNGFVHITGLFESKKGGSFTVFLKEDMLEKLADAQEDDLLGVSESKYGMSLWIKKADE